MYTAQKCIKMLNFLSALPKAKSNKNSQVCSAKPIVRKFYSKSFNVCYNSIIFQFVKTF